jgi:polyhydroxyalkanoate synthesis regulator phasin
MFQIVGGVAVGAAAIMLAPSIMSMLAGVVKPVAKTLIKGGMLAFESGKEAVKEVVHEAEVAISSSVEAIEDLTAEAKAEISESHKIPVPLKKRKKLKA